MHLLNLLENKVKASESGCLVFFFFLLSINWGEHFTHFHGCLHRNEFKKDKDTDKC